MYISRVMLEIHKIHKIYQIYHTEKKQTQDTAQGSNDLTRAARSAPFPECLNSFLSRKY